MLDGACDISESTWHAVSSTLPSELRGAPALYLAVSGDSLSATLRFAERTGAILVAEVSTARFPVKEVDVSPGMHDSRIEAVRERGGAPDSAVYALRIGS